MIPRKSDEQLALLKDFPVSAELVHFSNKWPWIKLNGI